VSIDEGGKWQKDWMATATGRSVFPLAVTPEDVVIEDIAHSLAQNNRYNGHAKFPYPVAQHSWLISMALSRDGHPPLVALTGLLHDASETWTGDITKPMKNSLKSALAPLGKEGWLKSVEHEIEETVAKRFGLPFPWPHVVEEYDTRIVVDEKAVLFKPTAQPWNIPSEPLGVVIEPWTWFEAKERFLARFEELGGRA
jgi:uncharacterized protein